MNIVSFFRDYRLNKSNKKKIQQLHKTGKNLILFGKPDFINPTCISIGDNVNINDRVILNATDSEIVIGNSVTISSCAMILAASYDTNKFLAGKNGSKKHRYGKITIGDHVWICAGAIILPNVTIPDHVIVAAGSIVVKEITESWCVVAGNPARIVKRIEHGNETDTQGQESDGIENA